MFTKRNVNLVAIVVVVGVILAQYLTVKSSMLFMPWMTAGNVITQMDWLQIAGASIFIGLTAKVILYFIE